MRGTLRAWSLAVCSALGKAEPHIGQWPLLPVHRPCHHGGLQSCTRAARSFLAAGRSWPSRARRSGGSAGSRGSARTRSVHRAWSVSAAEPVLRPTWRHRTAKLARRGRAQGSAGPSGERARRDRREPLAPLVRRNLPARKATRVRADLSRRHRNGDVSCAWGELLAGFVCASGAIDGASARARHRSD